MLLGPTSQTPGKCEDNASKAPKTCSHHDKDSDRHHSTPPLPQSHGTTNWSPWTLIEPGPQEETEEGGAEDSQEEASQGQTM